MSEYQLTSTDSVTRTVDGVSIPNDLANRDCIAYQGWLKAGNIPDPYIPDPNIAIAKARSDSFNVDTTRQDLLAQLKSSTPAQINTYVNNQVIDLNSAKTLLKKILLVMAIV